MAYIARVKGRNGKRSPFWHVFWWDAAGRQHNKTTRTKNRDEALAICHGTRTTARLAKAGRLTAETARDVITSIVSDLSATWTGNTLHTYTLREWCSAWLKSKESEIAERTLARYTGVIEQLCKFSGAGADRSLASFTVEEATRFRDHLVETLSAGSAKIAVKTLKACLSDATDRGLIPANTLRTLRSPKVTAPSVRRAFTTDEIRALLKHATGEWRGLILFGLYTGQRLGDVRSWTWRNINTERGLITFTTGKTKAAHTIAISNVLADYIATLPAPDNMDAPLFPDAARASVGTLSNRFYDVMEDAGLVPPRTHQKDKKKKGRSASRVISPISYHSFRHTLSTWLDSTASPAISARLIGHESAAVHRGYSHIEQETIRAALNKLPDVTA